MTKPFEQLRNKMGKVKELPYEQGYACGESGGRVKDNPYWENYDKGHEWAFSAWLNGWNDGRKRLERYEQS